MAHKKNAEIAKQEKKDANMAELAADRSVLFCGHSVWDDLDREPTLNAPNFLHFFNHCQYQNIIGRANNIRGGNLWNLRNHTFENTMRSPNHPDTIVLGNADNCVWHLERTHGCYNPDLPINRH